MSSKWFLTINLVCLVGLLSGCYYTPKTKRARADRSYLSEIDAESLITKKLAPYGIKFIYNMKMQRGSVMFIADGYDRNMRVGFEYRSHEGRDFEGQDGQSAEGLTDDEIGFLQNRQKDFREYFLIVEEGTREQVEQAVDQFVRNLYSWEVLKKAKAPPGKDSLFPEKDEKKDLLPWETTGSLKKKRKEMEEEESMQKVDTTMQDSSWESVDGIQDDEWGEKKVDEGREDEDF